MALFLLQVTGLDGNILYNEYVELPCDTTDEALRSSRIQGMKKEARFQNLAFRVKVVDK